jgi:hypothetical protein
MRNAMRRRCGVAEGSEEKRREKGEGEWARG